MVDTIILQQNEAPPIYGEHVLLVHRRSDGNGDTTVHDITGTVQSAGTPISLPALEGIIGSKLDAVRQAEEVARAHGVSTVYIRDNTRQH